MSTTMFEINFSTGKLEPIAEATVKIGQVLQMEGYSNPSAVVVKLPDEGSHFVRAIDLKDLKERRIESYCLKHISAKKDSRIAWYITDRYIMPERLEEMKAAAVIAQREAAEAAIIATRNAATARENEIARILREYPYLEDARHNKKSTWAVGCANLKRELSHLYPGVKFTGHSGGSLDINIHWTDGPTSEEVKKVINKYQECDFDGMNDSETYRNNVWSDIFGGARYTFGNRHMSDEAQAKIMKRIGITDPEARDEWHRSLVYLEFQHTAY